MVRETRDAALAARMARERVAAGRDEAQKCASVLTDEQLALWLRMTGPPFNFFPADR